jgi:cell division protein FtsQ
LTVTEQAPADAEVPTRRSRTPWLLAGAGVVVAVCGAVYVGGWTSVMGVQDILVEGTEAGATQQIVQTAGIAEGTPMMRVDVRAATARLADLPQVAAVDVRREWPRRVVITITARQAVAIQKAGERWELLDANGVPFAVAAQRPKNLPVVERASDEAVNTAMLKALAGMSPQVRAEVASVSATSPTSIQFTLRKRDAVVNWGSAEESEYKSQVLEVLLGVEAGWYDVSNPDTPTTADAAPQPGASADPAQPSVSPSASPSATPTAVATPTAAPTPTTAEAPVGVVPQTD